jgi:uncharacterized protein YkwD
MLAVLFVVLASTALVRPAAASAGPQARMLAALNEVRERHGLAPVRPTRPIARTSRSYARRLARQGRLQHASRIRGARQRGIGEILAVAPDGCAIRCVVRAWLSSPTHRPLVLRPTFRFAGVGAARGSWGSTRASYWVVRFAER